MDRVQAQRSGPNDVGQCVSALANSAALLCKDAGWIVWALTM